MASKKGRIALLGMIGCFPYAGVTMHYIQYALALEEAGYDVCYFEDEQPSHTPYHPLAPNAQDSRLHVDYLAGAMKGFGMEDRWSYSSLRPTPALHGMSALRRGDCLSSCDALICVGGLAPMTEEFLHIPRRVFVDTDPGRAQIKLANGDALLRRHVEGYTHHYTFGENLGKPSCEIPDGGLRWRPARQPIHLPFWDGADSGNRRRDRYTTILNWESRGKDLTFAGKLYAWGKSLEWKPVMDLPSRIPRETFELAIAIRDPDARQNLLDRGWRLADAWENTKSLDRWKNWLLDSKGEFTAAKHIYVETRSGWFSERSASYLAAGRPVVTQDTGFSDNIPSGEGLFSWKTADDVVAAMDAIRTDPDRHDRAARELARTQFDGKACAESLLLD